MSNELTQLKRQLPYKWRVQSVNEHNAVCVAYIDSRDVQDLLDEVVGQGNWQSDYKEVKGNVYGGVGIRIENDWVWKWDCGVESKTEAEKGEASDSFKRAAVKWGIGRFLYSLDIVKLKTKDYKGKYYPVNNNGDIIWSGDELTDFINSIKNTPSHNRSANGTKVKPLISNAQFKTLYERVKGGDVAAIDKAREIFSFEPAQEKQLQSLQLKTA